MVNNEDKNKITQSDTVSECSSLDKEQQQNDSKAENIVELELERKSDDNAQNSSVSITDKVEQQIAESFDGDIPQPKKKKYGWLGTVFLFVVIAMGLYLMIKLASTIGEGEMQSFDDVFKNINWTYFGITIALLLISMFADCLKYSVVTSTVKGRANLATSSKVAFLGKYYDNITPFASGGQPMQIYYLYKKGYTGGEATAVILIKYFANMFAWVSICFFLMIFNKNALYTYVQDATTRNVFLVAGWIGWAVNAMLPAIIILFVILPKLTTKMVGGIIGLGHKMKLVKDKDKAINRAFKGVHEFRSGFRIMSQHPFKFILLMLLCIIEPFITTALPYFVLVSLGGSSVEAGMSTMFAVMALNVYASMSVSVIPTPGNSGFVENAVLLAFRNIAKTVLFWVVFVWRFITYYIYILIGLFLTVFDMIRKAVRNRRSKTKENADIE